MEVITESAGFNRQDREIKMSPVESKNIRLGLKNLVKMAS